MPRGTYSEYESITVFLAANAPHHSRCPHRGFVMIKRAVVTADNVYRYQLQRWWDERPPAVFVMLNPSTADAKVDDRTVGRVISFATNWGCGGVIVVNLFAFRATKPEHLLAATQAGIDTVGPRNNAYLVEASTAAAHGGWPIIAAWGADAPSDRVDRVLQLPGVGRFQTLGTTANGAPRHPLYVSGDTRLQPWVAAA